MKNFSYSTIATAPSPANNGTSLAVSSGDGALFPPTPFYATVWPRGVIPLASNAEIILVTNVSTNTFTIQRAKENTSARTILVGDQIIAGLTAGMFDAKQDLSSLLTSISSLSLSGNSGKAIKVKSSEDGFELGNVSSSGGATVNLYTANDTWINPSPSVAKRMFIRLVGGGGGGGSGRKGASGSVRCGGGGGATGSVTEYWALTTEFGSTVSVTVGAGGTGGAAQTTNSTNGNPGTNGGDTIFSGTNARGGCGGGGGTNSSGTAGAALGTTVVGLTAVIPQAGAPASGTGGVGWDTGVQSVWLPTGGGGGGGVTDANVASSGGLAGPIGQWSTILEIAGGTAGGANAAGGNGNSGRGSGTGGGGGGGSTTANGGNGGNGGGHGAGGGGGGAATDSVGNSGKGGDGSPGYALVITFS